MHGNNSGTSWCINSHSHGIHFFLSSRRELFEKVLNDTKFDEVITHVDHLLSKRLTLLSTSQENDPNPLCKHIWGTKIWPKVSKFLWLIGPRRLMTCDCVGMKDFSRLSCCPLCQEEEESLENIVNKCDFTKDLWNKKLILFKHNDISPNSLVESLELFHFKWFKNLIVNRAWILALGFVLWNVLKERNREIFDDSSLQEARFWTLSNII